MQAGVRPDNIGFVQILYLQNMLLSESLPAATSCALQSSRLAIFFWPSMLRPPRSNSTLRSIGQHTRQSCATRKVVIRAGRRWVKPDMAQAAVMCAEIVNKLAVPLPQVDQKLAWGCSQSLNRQLTSSVLQTKLSSS